MKIFNRHPLPSAVDEHLTYFTTAEANTFRELVRASFADVGRDVTVSADHVEDRTGTTFGLWNIGALCAREEVQDWADLIDDHVERVTTPTRELGDLTRDELEARVHLQLVDAVSVPEPEPAGYARAVAPGLVEVISVDLPDSVVTPEEDDLRTYGALDELGARARANLRGLLDSGDVAVEHVVGETGGRFIVVTGDSFFTASLALLLPELTERFSAESDEGRGVLVAVPFRHELLYRVVSGSDTGAALDDLFLRARRQFRSNAGALSPDVYWVRNHRWVAVTSTDGRKPTVLLETGIRDACG